MRRALAMAVAVTLGACNVDVEGARCTAPGSPDACPDGQACGNDLRCSVRAASCAAEGTLCTPGVTSDRCRGNAVKSCTASDAVCGTWATRDDCGAASLLCDDLAGPPVCEGGGCTQPGTDEECPAGQACGNDHRCTLRAAACVAGSTFCRPGVHPDRCDGTTAVQTCSTEADAVCGAWVVKADCAATALVCNPAGGTPVCEGGGCTVPGTPDVCPDGQACGNDHRCTIRAAACAGPDFCTPGVPAAAPRCQGDSTQECTAVDSACAAWTNRLDCAHPDGKVCELQQDGPACVGRPCTRPGQQDVCDAGQACGNDLRCSTEAAACVATYCAPGTAPRCEGTAAQTCEVVSPVCSTWSTQVDCSATSQICESSSGAPACVGQHCAAAGTHATCPSGQDCGNDLRCSAEAASCRAAGTFCTPGTTADRCASSAVQTCTPEDAVCGSWSTTDDCAARALVCDVSTVACACARPIGNDVFAVDVDAPASTLARTGAAEPAQCRFTKLGDALAAAVARGGPAVVKAFGAEGTPVVFAGEPLPLVIPPGVTLSGADSPAGETVLKGDSATPAVSMVSLKGTLERVHLQNVSMVGNAVDAACGATGVPTLRDVTITSGTTKLAKGIAAAGACGALLERVDVSGASGPALDVAASSTSTAVTVSGSKLRDSGSGVQVAGGRLVLQNDLATRSEVTDNASTGVFVTGSAAVDVTLAGVLVARNHGTGIIVGSVPDTSAFRMTGSEVHSNATVLPTQYGPLPRRNAGGILFAPQARLATFDLQGNQVYANGGAFAADQIAFETGTGWVMKPSSCATANAIGCIGTGFSVSIVTPGTVDAGNTTWPGLAPVTKGFVETTPACLPAWSAPCP